jgi:small subunit ribosomal protein S16
MLSIRLSRTGKKSQPSYRLIVSEKAKDPWGTYLEILGLYNPKIEAKITNLKEDRLKYWIEKGAKLSATVNNLLVGQGVINVPKVKVVKVKKAPVAPTVAAPKKEAAPAKPSEAVKPEEPKKEEPKAEPKVETPVEAPAEAPKA